MNFNRSVYRQNTKVKDASQIEKDIRNARKALLNNNDDTPLVSLRAAYAGNSEVIDETNRILQEKKQQIEEIAAARRRAAEKRGYTVPPDITDDELLGMH